MSPISADATSGPEQKDCSTKAEYRNATYSSTNLV